MNDNEEEPFDAQILYDELYKVIDDYPDAYEWLNRLYWSREPDVEAKIILQEICKVLKYFGPILRGWDQFLTQWTQLGIKEAERYANKYE